MGYALTYASDKRQIIKIGANLDSKKRNLDGWEVEKSNKASCGNKRLEGNNE